MVLSSEPNIKILKASYIGVRNCVVVVTAFDGGELMTNLLERITINPDQCGGRPCIRGMRIRVIDVLDLFAAGDHPVLAALGSG